MSPALAWCRSLGAREPGIVAAGAPDIATASRKLDCASRRGGAPSRRIRRQRLAPEHGSRFGVAEHPVDRSPGGGRASILRGTRHRSLPASTSAILEAPALGARAPPLACRPDPAPAGRGLNGDGRRAAPGGGLGRHDLGSTPRVELASPAASGPAEPADIRSAPGRRRRASVDLRRWATVAIFPPSDVLSTSFRRAFGPCRSTPLRPGTTEQIFGASWAAGVLHERCASVAVFPAWSCKHSCRCASARRRGAPTRSEHAGSARPTRAECSTDSVAGHGMATAPGRRDRRSGPASELASPGPERAPGRPGTSGPGSQRRWTVRAPPGGLGRQGLRSAPPVERASPAGRRPARQGYIRSLPGRGRWAGVGRRRCLPVAAFRVATFGAPLPPSSRAPARARRPARTGRARPVRRDGQRAASGEGKRLGAGSISRSPSPSSSRIASACSARPSARSRNGPRVP